MLVIVNIKSSAEQMMKPNEAGGLDIYGMVTQFALVCYCCKQTIKSWFIINKSFLTAKQKN